MAEFAGYGMQRMARGGIDFDSPFISLLDLSMNNCRWFVV
jgi:hypothetical protein